MAVQVSYNIDIACKGGHGEVSRMWRALSRPIANIEGAGSVEATDSVAGADSAEGVESAEGAREFSLQELAALAGKDADSLTASVRHGDMEHSDTEYGDTNHIDTGAFLNSIRAEKPQGSPENWYPLLAKAFPDLNFFIVQFSFSGTSCACACFEAKNGRMRQSGAWEDESREAGEQRRAWLGALQGHWLLDSPAPRDAEVPPEPVSREAAGGDHGLSRMEKQTSPACLEAVQADGEALAYVRKQTPKICRAAVEESGRALRFVEKQSPAICRAALRRDGLALEYVREKTRELCLAAVKQNYLAYRYVQETSPALYRQFMKGFEEAMEKTAAARQR
ncbi:MAG: DUF4116 domain-containing protein [Spirochaetales bacterium]|jgi:hypothetical protein|nr:DUF4116 domain-containing protein [Spirochaetales bacterium]